MLYLSVNTDLFTRNIQLLHIRVDVYMELVPGHNMDHKDQRSNKYHLHSHGTADASIGFR